MEGWKSAAILVGRILLAVVFFTSGIGKIGNFEGTAQYMAKAGMPLSHFFLVGAIFCEVIGSLAVIVGLFARFGTFVLIIFLIPTTLIFHTNFADPGQKIHFMKNMSMWGGLFVLFAAGAGKFSLDYLFRKRL